MLVALLEICDIYRYIMIPIMRHIRNEGLVRNRSPETDS